MSDISRPEKAAAAASEEGPRNAASASEEPDGEEDWVPLGAEQADSEEEEEEDSESLDGGEELDLESDSEMLDLEGPELEGVV